MFEDLRLDSKYDGFLFLAESVRNPPVLRPHCHAELELNLVVEGEITYVHENQCNTFPKRSLLWLFPEQVHQLVDRTSNAAYYVAVFTPRMLEETCSQERYAQLKSSKLSDSGILNTVLKPEEFDRMVKQMEELIEDGLDPDLLNREAGFGQTPDFRFAHNDPDWLNAGLRHLLLKAWRLQSGRRRGGREVSLHPAVRNALEIIGQEGDERDLADIAAEVGVSSSYLSRTFKQEVGVSLIRYRNSIRLGRFWKIYRRKGCDSVLEAAMAAGFGSYSQFYRVYTDAYGQGPRKTL